MNSTEKKPAPKRAPKKELGSADQWEKQNRDTMKECKKLLKTDPNNALYKMVLESAETALKNHLEMKKRLSK